MQRYRLQTEQIGYLLPRVLPNHMLAPKMSHFPSARTRRLNVEFQRFSSHLQKHLALLSPIKSTLWKRAAPYFFSPDDYFAVTLPNWSASYAARSISLIFPSRNILLFTPRNSKTEKGSDSTRVRTLPASPAFRAALTAVELSPRVACWTIPGAKLKDGRTPG